MLMPVALLPLLALARASDGPPANLARSAEATASETFRDLTPEKAIDGDPATRWSGIPGHNEGVWYQLAWPEPVRVAHLVLRQYDSYVMELDVQVRGAGAEEWQTVRHLGRPGEKLPKVIVVDLAPVETDGLRLASITNGPSFVEVEAYEVALLHCPAVALASDCDGGFLGMVSDEWGSSPLARMAVELVGDSEGGPWRGKAETDEHGLFAAPMPPGLTGAVTTRVRIGSTEYRTTHEAAALPYGLIAPGARVDAVDLGGSWRFATDPPEGFERPGYDDAAWAHIAVPGHWEMQGFRSLDGVGGYRRVFTAPTGAGRAKLRFDGVYSGCIVWVNGERCAMHDGGATPFEVDVTRLLRPGANLLALRVCEHMDASDQLDHMSQYAGFPLAGIIRPVTLFRTPDAHIASVKVETPLSPDGRDATLRLAVAAVNEGDAHLTAGALQVRLWEPDGREVRLEAPRATVDLGPRERHTALLEIPVTAPAMWDAEHPNLYRLEVRLLSGGATVHRWSQRIGFREVNVEGTRILVNGSPVKLRGTCHHDSHPLLGRAVTAELERQDLLLMKEANLNAVRTSHYPPHPALLEAADELGLYVEDEAPFCWCGASDGLRLTPHILQLTAELIARDRNHPSVFMWSLCNESQFGYGFRRSHEWVRRADPTRPTGAATSEWLETEIATLHNPLATSRIEENEGLDRPLLFDESMAPFQGIWGDRLETWVDPGVRDYYAKPWPEIWRAFMASKVTQGSFIWAWSDDVFCVPGRGLEVGRSVGMPYLIEESYRTQGRGIVGDAPWGVVDGWRRKKPEFWAVRKIHSPVKVTAGSLAVPKSGAPIVVGVENQYDFTDLSALRIEWRLGEESGLVTDVSVPPRATGEMRIEPPRAPKRGEVLELTFTDSAGRQVDECRLAFGSLRAARPHYTGVTPGPLRILSEETLAGRSVRVAGADFELAFDRDSGLLRRCVAFGRSLIVAGPSLRLVRGYDPSRARAGSDMYASGPSVGMVQAGDPRVLVPSAETWQLEDLRVEEAGESVRVTVTGRYAGLAGAYETLITPSGEVTTTARFVYEGESLTLRGIGLSVAVPRDCDTLRWARRGEWSLYPEDHIGRTVGTARAEVAHPDVWPPTWPWSEDSSPLGTNDFRSTKRSIDWAGLAYPDGPGVLVLSDGSQNARATRESDRTTLCVTDWYEGTSAGLWEWTHNYGIGRTLDTGARIETTLRLRLVRFDDSETEGESAR